MEISSANWSEVAEANSLVPPSGFSTGEDPGDVKLTFREMMAALKRDRNWSHPIRNISLSAGTVLLITPTTLLSGYVDGMIYAGVLQTEPGSILTNPKLQIASGSQQNFYLPTITSVDRPFDLNWGRASQPCLFCYDASLPGFVLISQPAYENVSEDIICPITGASGTVAAGTGLFTFRMPYAFHPVSYRASLATAQTSGSILTVDVKAGGLSVFSTNKLTIDNGEKTSETATTPATIFGSNKGDDTEIKIDVTQIGDGTAKGLTITIVGYQT